MRRKLSAVAAALLATALIAPVGAADTIDAPSPSGGKQVAESAINSYIVVMAADPLLATVSTNELNRGAAATQAAAIEESHDQVLADAGIAADAKVQDYTNALNGFSVSVGHDEAVKIAANPEVAYVLPDELRQPTSFPGEKEIKQTLVGRNTLYQFMGLTEKSDAWRNGITGEGVVVGVIDTGIWPEHPSFADDGTYPEHAPLDETTPSCNFGNTAANPDDLPFTCNNKLIGAREFLDTYKLANGGLAADEFDSARDDDGHGTHTASTAAGNAGIRAEVFGRFKDVVSGIAPRAQIIAYKALGNDGGFTSDLVAAIDQAVADGVDVINYSIGGGASTVSPDTISFLFASDAGVFSAVSAGNSGPGESTIGGPGDVPWVTTVGANTQRRMYDGYIKMNNGVTIRGASVTHGTPTAQFVDAEFAGAADSEFCVDGTLDPTQVTGKVVLCKRGLNGRVAKSAEVLRAGGIGMVLYNASDVDTLFSDNFFVPTVMVDYTQGLIVKNWIASTGSPIGRLAGGGPGLSIVPAPTMAYFSSRGENPTAGDIIKPDVTAPGVGILAGNTPFPTPGEQVPGELFQAIAGTSMSSPVVAGLFALIKQVHPDWSQAAAKSALMTTANTKVLDNDRVSAATPFSMGAGMARPGKPGSRDSSFDPGLVYEAGFAEYLGFLCDEGPEIFANPARTCGNLAAAGVPTDAANLNLPSIGVESVPGSVTVTRTVTSVADQTITYKAWPEAPAGYTVSVSPNTLTLAPGATASFAVTITNDGSAPVGEWRFGSLTWSGGSDSIGRTGHAYGGYNPRIPIAVKGTLLDVVQDQPTSVGTEGSGTLTLTFGYSGTYSAYAHGLVPAQDLDGLISQDPDQTWPSPDDGVGVVSMPLTFTNVALARMSLVLPGDDDLDVYLVGPDGSVVAQSTNGGTDEQIDVIAPADGDYTLIVHGWAVASPDTAFTVQSWLVPGGQSAAGSLQITQNASGAAVIGASVDVGYGWSGLTDPGNYLGAVSVWADASGPASLTPVVVTVPAP